MILPKIPAWFEKEAARKGFVLKLFHLCRFPKNRLGICKQNAGLISGHFSGKFNHDKNCSNCDRANFVVVSVKRRGLPGGRKIQVHRREFVMGRWWTTFAQGNFRKDGRMLLERQYRALKERTAWLESDQRQHERFNDIFDPNKGFTHRGQMMIEVGGPKGRDAKTVSAGQ